MSVVSVQVDPASELQPPRAGQDIMNTLRVQAGLFGAMDGIVYALTRFSPLNEWVFKPVAGDWTALQKGADAWRNTGKAAQQLARVLESFPAQVADGWQGATADSWGTANGTVVSLLQELPDQCQKMATTCDAIAQAAQAVASLIADLLSQLGNLLIRAGIEAAIPVAGWAAEVETAGELAARITAGGIRISNAITRFAGLIERLAPMLERIAGLGAQVLAVATRLSSVAPRAIEAAEFLATNATTLQTVGRVVGGADKLVTFGKDAINIADKTHDADVAAQASR
jgi:hypothetical protein